jgi:hypothetical protein
MKSEAKSQKNQVGLNSGSKGHNKRKWGKRKHGLLSDKKKLVGKKAKRDLSKVKCFNCDNNGHLMKYYPKPPRVSDCISQGKLVFQGGFMDEIGVHESVTSNLLKLNYKINNEIVGCLLDS